MVDLPAARRGVRGVREGGAHVAASFAALRRRWDAVAAALRVQPAGRMGGWARTAEPGTVL